MEMPRERVYGGNLSSDAEKLGAEILNRGSIDQYLKRKLLFTVCFARAVGFSIEEIMGF